MSDWRADNAKHLRGLSLHRRRWTRPRYDWDHDHCAGCFAKFAESDEPEIQRGGFTTGADHKHGTGYAWVCVQCFADLQNEMGWAEHPDGS